MQFAPVQPERIQRIRQQVDQVFCAVLQFLREVLLCVRVALLIQQIAQTKNCVKRVPDLVAHGRHKLAFRSGKLIGFFFGLNQTGFRKG